MQHTIVAEEHNTSYTSPPAEYDGFSVDQEGARDLGLLFRWRLPPEVLCDTRLPWTGNRLEDHAIGAIVAEALAAAPTGQRVSFSLRRAWWTGKTLLGGPAFTYAYVRRATEILHGAGWIVVTKGERRPGGSGLQSTFIASDKLVGDYGADRLLSYKLRQPVFLRGADRELMPLSQTRELGRIRKRLHARNEAIASVDLRIVAPDVEWTPDRRMMIDGGWYDPRKKHAHIVYNGDVRHGGRLYGLPYQTVNQREHSRRGQLQIDGSSVVEPDFSGCHPRLLYHERGLQPDGDLYDVVHEVYDRDDAKLAMQILLNASSERQGIAAFAWKKARQETQAAVNAGEAPWDARRLEARAREHMPEAQVLFDALKAKHDPIAGALFTGVGGRLQCVETAIMTKAAMHCLSQGIIVLPMHDSAITKAEHGSILAESMVGAYVESTGFEPLVKAP